MVDHGTRRTTTDRLEEAIAALSEKHTDLACKVEAMLNVFHITTLRLLHRRHSSHIHNRRSNSTFLGLTVMIHSDGSSKCLSSSITRTHWRKIASRSCPSISTEPCSAGSNGCIRMASSRCGQPFFKRLRLALLPHFTTIPAKHSSNWSNEAQLRNT